MIFAPLPDNEEARLASLRELQILDTEIEDSFEEVTDLVAEICDVPISHISLMDRDRQWFKSVRGFKASDVPRELTFCSHTILQHDLLVVEDARKDKRFLDNPFVTGSPHIIFYAGMPLESPEHFCLGTLCVLDSKPRKLTNLQKKALKILARQVANQFELRRIMNRLTDAKVKEATMAMVVTYNHEINNPLATLKCLTQISQDRLPQKTYKILHQSIDRISDVVKSIESTLRDVGVEFENYTGEIKMMKIKGKDTTKGTVKSKAKKTAKVD